MGGIFPHAQPDHERALSMWTGATGGGFNWTRLPLLR